MAKLTIEINLTRLRGLRLFIDRTWKVIVVIKIEINLTRLRGLRPEIGIRANPRFNEILK